ncbi:hypothetical protein B0H14DRAFT_2392601, partial [Mycena olivaceomarginata]
NHEDFLDELLWHDGRRDNPDADCPGAWCGAKARYRCMDCFHPTLHCGSCVVGFHQRLPFHHIDRWDGQCFERCTLKSLGVRIQLGHRLGEKCPNPAPASGADFVIITSQTIDEVELDYCNCSLAQSKPVQLLCMRLYPTTGTNPRSAATFSALRRFAHMSLESKCSAYEFYNSLVRETDNTGLVPSRERYQEFLRMTCQWMHLQLVKHAGRGHDPCEDRINTTQAGECALLCPACPQPGKNLPPGWENVPFHKAFLYVLYIALDANFRLRRRDVSSEEKDPGFMKGWAFFGEVTKYMAHLEKHAGQIQERSTCVAHDAVDKPDRESLGMVSSGIGTVNCAQHNMKRPNGVGDLQRGERYLNMDYILFMSLARVMQLIRFYISYDIACQWFKNLFTWMGIFDSDLQFRRGEQYLVFLIPKFHLPAHIEACNLAFSFNLTPFVGRTDGEAPERGWADANRLANSTSISGPGAQCDALDAHFQYWNWKKIVSLGETLLTWMQKYVPMMLETRAAWVDLEASFADTMIETWTAMATAWEADPSQPNPFATTPSGREDLKEVRRKLAEVAAADVGQLRVRGDMHETEMLSMGLQLEDQQRALATHVKHVGLHETVDQGRKRIQQETKLRHKIEAWMVIQQLFIPEVTLLRESDDAARKRVSATQPLPGIRAQDVKLWMPSAVGRCMQCDQALQEYEFQLREGQCEASLDELRTNLLLRTHEYQYRDGVHGVKAKLRSGTRTNALTAQITKASEEYRAACAALVNLGAILQRKGWEKRYKVLAEADVRGRPSAVFGDDERAEDRKAMSWIWVMEGMTGEDGDVVHNEALRIEWAKTRAKAMRYAEEVDLLKEEMCRVLQFLGWRAEWWRSLVGLRAESQSPALREGHTVYAHRQAAYMEGLQSRFRSQWRDIDKLLMSARKTYATMLPDEDKEETDKDTDTDEGEQGAGPAAAWLSD